MVKRILITCVALAVIAVVVWVVLTEPPSNGNGEDESRYGGSLTYRRIGWQMKGFDPLVWDNNNMNSIIFDRYFTAPWERGQTPSGTGELELKQPYYPIGDYRGEYLQSFSRDDLWTVTFQLREGITYWDMEPVNGREMTVDDIIWNSLYQTFHPRAGSYQKADPDASLTFWTDYMAEIGANATMDARLTAHLDELRVETPLLEAYWPFAGTEGMGNTLQEHMETYYADSYAVVEAEGYDVSDLALLTSYYHKVDDHNWYAKHCRGSQSMWSGLNGIWPTPKEVTEVDEFTNWETAVGTGPWILTDFFPASHGTFIRNPDYWQNDPVPARSANQLPYAASLEFRIIEDEGSYYAALEAKQLDGGALEWYKVQHFIDNYVTGKGDQAAGTTPGTMTSSCLIFLQNQQPPFNDKRVRHACMLAIDHVEFLAHYAPYGQLLTWPNQSFLTEAFTPMASLPTEIQEMFGEEDLVAAGDLLDAAGYPGPDRFTVELVVYPSGESADVCTIVKDYLAAVGITVNLINVDAATYGSMLYDRTYNDMISCWWGNDSPGDVLYWAEGGVLTSPYNFGDVIDTTAYELALQLALILDDSTRNALIKADDVRRLGEMYQLCLPTAQGYGFWWPWIKGYSGESDLGLPDETGWGEIPKYIWIDEVLKASMGA